MFTIPPTLEQVQSLQVLLLESLGDGAGKLKSVLPYDVLVSILRATDAVLRTEPSLVELSVDNGAECFVFGDTHGHFPDVAHMLNQLGYPSASRIYIFNGDYVDRGSWGVELLAILCALKLAAPNWVYLLRGNHESATCTKYYGYYQEVRAKYEKQAKDVYTASKRLFSALPLAAVVQHSTLIMHGGLFRRPPEHKRGVKRRKPNYTGRAGAAAKKLEPGTLDDLRNATKGGMDPDGTGTSLLATDVLWSDPVAAPGFAENDARGVGLTFGPDITEAFLRANRLRLIIRSHEGPDARDKRSDLPQVLQGYSVDHDTPAGQLVTVFSAPDYPQFQVVEADEDGAPGHRYENLAAVAVLSGPDYATPNMRTFEAVKPRPKADAYYDYAVCCDSDAEVPAASDATATTSNAPSEAANELEPDEEDAEEVVGPSAPELLPCVEAAGPPAPQLAPDEAGGPCAPQAQGGDEGPGTAPGTSTPQQPSGDEMAGPSAPQLAPDVQAVGCSAPQTPGGDEASGTCTAQLPARDVCVGPAAPQPSGIEAPGSSALQLPNTGSDGMAGVEVAGAAGGLPGATGTPAAAWGVEVLPAACPGCASGVEARDGTEGCLKGAEASLLVAEEEARSDAFAMDVETTPLPPTRPPQAGVLRLGVGDGDGGAEAVAGQPPPSPLPPPPLEPQQPQAAAEAMAAKSTVEPSPMCCSQPGRSSLAGDGAPHGPTGGASGEPGMMAGMDET